MAANKENIISKLYLWQTRGCFQSSPRANAFKLFTNYSTSRRYKMDEILDIEGEIKRSGHIILGFTEDGRHLISYTLVEETQLDIYEPLKYTYTLHWWLFGYRKPLVKVHSVGLFKNRQIYRQLSLLITQTTDEKQLIVWGSSFSGSDVTSCPCFVTICASEPSQYCNACQDFGDRQKCFQHSFSVHFTYDVYPPYPIFVPWISLLIPGILLVNCGTSLVAIKCLPCLNCGDIDSAIKDYMNENITNNNETERDLSSKGLSTRSVVNNLPKVVSSQQGHTYYSFRAYQTSTDELFEDIDINHEIQFTLFSNHQPLSGCSVTSSGLNNPSILVCQAFLDIEECIHDLIQSHDQLSDSYKSLRDYDCQLLTVSPKGDAIVMVKVLVHGKRSLSNRLQIGTCDGSLKTGFVFSWNIWTGDFQTLHYMSVVDHPEKEFTESESSFKDARALDRLTSIPVGVRARSRALTNRSVFSEKSLKYIYHPFLPILIFL